MRRVCARATYIQIYPVLDTLKIVIVSIGDRERARNSKEERKKRNERRRVERKGEYTFPTKRKWLVVINPPALGIREVQFAKV
jgi:hypothetical protein